MLRAMSLLLVATGSRVDFCGQQWYSIFAQEARTRSAERTEVHLTTHRFHEQTFGLQMRTIRHT
jgi:hypothetical protein